MRLNALRCRLTTHRYPHCVDRHKGVLVLCTNITYLPNCSLKGNIAPFLKSFF